MSIEIRHLALQIASGMHKEVDEIITTAEKFATFLTGNTSAEPQKSTARKAAKEQVTQPADSPPADKQTSPVASSTAAQQPAAPTVTADHITKAIIAFCAKDKTKCLEVLQKFGVKRGGELKPEQLAEAHKALTAGLDALVPL